MLRPIKNWVGIFSSSETVETFLPKTNHHVISSTEIEYFLNHLNWLIGAAEIDKNCMHTKHTYIIFFEKLTILIFNLVKK